MPPKGADIDSEPSRNSRSFWLSPRFTGGVALSVFLLWVTFRNTDPMSVFSHLWATGPHRILAALACNLCFVILRGWLQQNSLAGAYPGASLSGAVSSYAYAVFFNTLLPARIGEAIRVVYLSGREKIPKTTIFTYVFVEKLADLCFIVALFFIFALIGIDIPELNRPVRAITIIVVVMVTGTLTYVWQGEKIRSWVTRVTPYRYRLASAVNRYLGFAFDGLSLLRSGRRGVVSLAIFLFGWLMQCALYWAIMAPFLEQMALPGYTSLFLMTLTALSFGLPAAPSGIGVAHFAIVTGVTLLKDGQAVDRNLAAAFAIATHFLIVSLDIAIGASIILWDKYLYRKALVPPREKS